MGTVQHVQLQLDRGQPIAELGVFACKGVLIELIVQPHVEQAILLGREQRGLTHKLGTLGLRIGLLVLCLRGQHGAEPLPHLGIVDPHGIEDAHDLPLNLGLGHAVPRMTRGKVSAAPVVDVYLVAGLAALDDALAGDRSAAVPALHEAARVGDVQGVVDMAAQEGLDTIPGRAFHQWLVLAGEEVPLVGNIADVAPVAEHGVHRGPGEFGSARAVRPALFMEAFDDTVDGQVFVGVQVEHPADVPRFDGFDDDGAATVGTDVAVAVGSPADEPAVLDTLGQALPHINSKLLTVECRHRREDSALERSGGIPLRVLGDAEQGDVVLTLQPFEFHEIREIAARAVNLVDDEPIEFVGTPLDVRDEFLEGLSFLRLGGGLRDAEEADDLAARLGGVLLQGVFLHRERETTLFLFTARDPGQGHEAFVGRRER